MAKIRFIDAAVNEWKLRLVEFEACGIPRRNRKMPSKFWFHVYFDGFHFVTFDRKFFFQDRHEIARSIA